MSAVLLRFEDAGLTHPGRVRSNNEDAFLARPAARLWTVADGMGGHDDGERASQHVVERLAAAELGSDFDEDLARVSEAIHAANAAIRAESEAEDKQMGSTVVALLIEGPRFAVFWVGDSRVYLMRDSQIVRLTRDHSQVQAMVDAGQLTPEEAATHPMSNVVTRAVGVSDDLEVDAILDEAEPGDVFILCSDGLTDVAADADIAEVAAGKTPSAAAQALLDLTLERGAPDNVSVVVVTCAEATAAAVEASAP
jgi:serine/threonine protein phosphatase PrpC